MNRENRTPSRTLAGLGVTAAIGAFSAQLFIAHVWIPLAISTDAEQIAWIRVALGLVPVVAGGLALRYRVSLPSVRPLPRSPTEPTRRRARLSPSGRSTLDQIFTGLERPRALS